MKRFASQQTLFAGLCVLAFLLHAAPSTAQTLHDFPFSREDPRLIEGNEACGQCHESAHEVWKQTKHAESFEKLHKRKRATEISRALDFKRGLKRDTRCLTCHFTSALDRKGEKEVAVSGISCESCHGAGKNWIHVHNDFGDYANNPSSEPAAHRRQRLEAARRGGMRPPDDFYQVASNCFQCHIVPFEDLVNDGDHLPGSASFEFLDRMEAIRHNFLVTYRAEQEPINAERPIERKRLMFVAGRALHLEYALRALAQATQEGGAFHSAAQERVEEAMADVADLTAYGGLALGKQLADAARRAPKSAGSTKAQLDAANRVSKATQQWLASDPNPKSLAALDPLLLGEVVAEVEEEVETPEAPAQTAGGDVNLAAQTNSSGASKTTTAPAADYGKLLRHVRPASQHKTVKCSGCHKKQRKWLSDHEHSQTAEPFLAQEAKNRQIARRYGISTNDMKTGEQICMDCHGTVISGKSRRSVSDGVSCQSCHGAGGDFLDSHEEDIENAFNLGMIDLSTADAQARACAQCHYITTERLLAAGHPNGRDFDLSKRMTSVVHWKPSSDRPGTGALASAWSKEIARRGPVPSVAMIPDPGPGSSGGGGGRKSDVTAKRPKPPKRPQDGGAREAGPSPTRRPQSTASPSVSPRPRSRGCHPEVEDWTPPSPDAAAVDQLTAIQQRLEHLYRAAGQGDCL